MNVPPFMARGDAINETLHPGGYLELIPNKPDKDRAAELKKRTLEVMEPFLRLKDEAAKEGFLIMWAGMAPNAYGRHEIIDLHLVKRF